jgi:hypothetical protein
MNHLARQNHHRRMHLLGAAIVVAALTASGASAELVKERAGHVDGPFDVPVLVGEPWQIAGNPDLGQYASSVQQPVDFAVWQAADGSWQLWSCIRGAECGGMTRLLYRWEGASIVEPNWTPMGVALEADPALGETEGGLQAPHVVLHAGRYHMLYGDWNNICLALSDDGKSFTRFVRENGRTGLFTEGAGVNTRDPMAIRIGDQWHVYVTCHPNDQGVVRVRTSGDLKSFRRSRTVSFGGRGGTGISSAECPHVVERNGLYYLFRTQLYGPQSTTHVYVSKSPLHFGVNRDEWYYATTLAVAAPEYVNHQGKEFLVSLNLGLDGIRAHRLTWIAADQVALAERQHDQ